tara:strand:+ start:107 stop:529 length:423 start_codon:yes stop_codon:yes gene_type:complete
VINTQQEKVVVTDLWTKISIEKTTKQFSESQRRKPRMTDPKILRLTTGEEILSKAEETDAGWSLVDPVILVPTGGKGLALAPWLPYRAEDSELVIKEQNIVFITTPHPDLVKEYVAATSKIITPPKSDIVGIVGPGMITE